MSETTDIVHAPDQAVIQLEHDADRLLAYAERRQAVMARLIILAIKQTNPSDWVDQNGKPYLQATGAQKIARIFGVNVHSPHMDRLPLAEHPGDYIYKHQMRFQLGADEITEIGAASSRDEFFAKTRDGWRALGEVDETDIIKKSYTNCFVRGITGLLGLRNLSWPQLEAAGINVREIAGVRYEGGKKGGAAQAPQSKAELDVDDGRRKELRAWVLAMAEGDTDGAKAMLTALTAFEKDGQTIPGVPTVDQLKGKRLEIAWSKAKKEHEEYAKAHPQQPELVGA